MSIHSLFCSLVIVIIMRSHDFSSMVDGWEGKGGHKEYEEEEMYYIVIAD